MYIVHSERGCRKQGMDDPWETRHFVPGSAAAITFLSNSQALIENWFQIFKWAKQVYEDTGMF